MCFGLVPNMLVVLSKDCSVAIGGYPQKTYALEATLLG